MVLHIPHASTSIPAQFRDQFLLETHDLDRQLLAVTDHFTDELYATPSAKTVTFSYSRLLVDVERFASEEMEPMSSVGMGAVYTRTSTGKPLRRALTDGERTVLETIYHDHHSLLHNAVQQELDLTNTALVVDCHSFPDSPLPSDQNQETPRPDFCIGRDPFHTPDKLVRAATSFLSDKGWNVGIDWPYTGALVPMAHYREDERVRSVMIDVNRRLYMDESTGTKNEQFETIAAHIRALTTALSRIAP